jgi:hypothetical protein
MAGSKDCVHDDQAPQSGAETGIDGQRQSDDAAPVSRDKGNGAEVKALDQSQQEAAMEMKPVILNSARLIGAAESEEVGSDDSTPALKKDGDHLTVQLTPVWLSVQTQEGVARVPRTQIEIMCTQPLVAGQIVHIVRRIREVLKIGEPIVRRA